MLASLSLPTTCVRGREVLLGYWDSMPPFRGKKQKTQKQQKKKNENDENKVKIVSNNFWAIVAHSLALQ